jgi:Domain of unknown function (DUF4331)
MASRPVIAGTSAIVMALLAGTLAAPTAAQGPDGLAHDRAAQVDDLYAFVSPDRPDTATIITTWGGPQEPSEWASAAWFDPDVTYWIKVDNTGDGAADITWTFRFLTQLDAPESILATGFGSVPGVPATVWQSVNVTRNGETMMSANVPPPNIGPRTTPGYGPLAQNYLGALDPNVVPERAGSLFVGQRDDPAFEDSGALGDLLGMRPLNAKHVQRLKKAKGQDDHAGRNTQVIAIQVPIGTLTADGTVPTTVDAPGAVVGIWAGASRLAADGTTLTQVSRVGDPLVDDWLIPYGEKAAWQAAEPAGDATYEARYSAPELATILNEAYPGNAPARTADRTDIVQLLGQGLPGLDQTTTTGVADLLRLNLAVPPAAKPNRLGLMGGDLAGYPNGRRLTDDVVDITLRAVGDGYGPDLAATMAAAGTVVPDLKSSRSLGDGCGSNDRKPLAAFPYVAAPWDGYAGGKSRKACSGK